MKTGDASAHNLLSYSLLFAFSHNVFPNRITNRTRNTSIKLYRYEVTTIAAKKIQLGMVLEPITEKSPNPSFSQLYLPEKDAKPPKKSDRSVLRSFCWTVGVTENQKSSWAKATKR